MSFLPDTEEELNDEYQRFITEKAAKGNSGKQKDIERKKASAVYDGDETTSINRTVFDEYFAKFKSLVEENDKTDFVSFSVSKYLISQEGYKTEIYEKARKALSLESWKREDVSTGKIFSHIISAIRLDKVNNNLIDWRLADKFEKSIKTDELSKYEESFFDFFFNEKTEEESLDSFVKYFGKNYPLIAYFFFIKNKEKYTPNNPNHSDLSLRKLGVNVFKTTARCSWKNYSKYNDLIGQVKNLLSEKGIKDVTLLDAHSFVWMVYKI